MSLFKKIRAVVHLLGSFVWDMFASTVTETRIVLSPAGKTHPAIIAFPLEVKKPWAVAMLAYFTSLTPGSTCLHVSEDRTRLYLHLHDARDAEREIANVRRLYEAPILELER